MEAKIEKMQEKFNKDLEELKDKHVEKLKNKQRKLELENLKASAQQKKWSTKWKGSLWEKIFANHISDKGLISKICKELTQFNSKKKNQIMHLKIGKEPE